MLYFGYIQSSTNCNGFPNMANVHTVSVDFLHILETMGVEARIYQYNQSESSHFFFVINTLVK